MRRLWLALGAALLIGVAAFTALVIAPRSHILSPPRASNGTYYVLYTHVPDACRAGGCRALYLLDGERWLPTFARASDREGLQSVIIVGIGYRDILNTMRRRKFDFTPSFGRTPGETGGAEAYLRVLQDEIIPYAEAHLPIEPGSRVLAGHSYAGLFAVYALAEAPDLFDDYLIMAPALWFDQSGAFAMTFEPPSGPRRVVLAADTPLDEGPSGAARDVRRLSDLLTAQRNIIVTTTILPGTNHDSMVAPSARTGLDALLGTAS